MSQNLKKCLPLIETYCQLKNRKDKMKYLKMFEDCIIRAAQEMSVNTLKGNVPMTTNQKKRLKRYKRALIALSTHSLPRLRQRKIIVQSGSGLFAALVPVIASVLAGALAK
jgi:glucan phosphorylase